MKIRLQINNKHILAKGFFVVALILGTVYTATLQATTVYAEEANKSASLHTGGARISRGLQPESCFVFSLGTITGYDETTCGSQVVIPATIGGNPVTAIGAEAFCPSGVALNITQVDFSNASNLTTIETKAFYECPIVQDTLTIPASVTLIGSQAFLARDKSIGTLVLEGSTRLGYYSFAYGTISKLKLNADIYVDDTGSGNLDYDGDQAFSHTNLASIEGFEHITTNWPKGLFMYSHLVFDTLTIPASVGEVGASTFRGDATDYTVMTSLVVHPNTRIGDFAFTRAVVPTITFQGQVQFFESTVGVFGSQFFNASVRNLNGEEYITGDIHTKTFAQNHLVALADMPSVTSCASDAFALQTIDDVEGEESGSTWTVDLSALSSRDANFDKTKVLSVTGATYNAATGIATFTSQPTSITYNYQVTSNGAQIAVMDVTAGVHYAPVPVPTTPPTTSPTSVRTCQDDGYPEGYTWVESKQACVCTSSICIATATPTASSATTPTATPTPTASSSATTGHPEIINTLSPDPSMTPNIASDMGQGNNGSSTSPTYRTNSYWALVNLIFLAVSLLLGIIQIFQKNKKQEPLYDENGEILKDEVGQEILQEYKKNRFWKILTPIVAVIALVLFLMTENLSRQMQLTDGWTIWMAALLILTILSFSFGSKWKEETKESVE